MSDLRVSLAARLIMLGTPLAWAVLSVLHANDHPGEGGSVGRWMTVHLGQLVLTVLLAYSIWALLQGLSSSAARVARIALPVWLVFFSAFDAVAGLATGWLARSISSQSAEEAAATNRAIEELFDENWLTGNFSVAGSIAAVAWAVIAISATIALRQAGAGRITVALMAASVLFANHPPPFSTLGMLAFFGAALRWDRRRQTEPVTTPLMTSGPASTSAVE